MTKSYWAIKKVIRNSVPSHKHKKYDEKSSNYLRAISLLDTLGLLLTDYGNITCWSVLKTARRSQFDHETGQTDIPVFP